MGKVDRSVDRVDDPFIGGISYDLTRLFAEDKVIGEVVFYDFENGLFGRVVCFGYQVINAFLV